MTIHMRPERLDMRVIGDGGPGETWCARSRCHCRVLLAHPGQKQERRAKARAGLDPSHPLASMDQDALHFDYQSSECSSAGEDSSDDDGDEGYHAEKVRRRAEAWANARETAGAGPSRGSAAGAGVGEYGWASGLGAKVLEIRTPSWRSSQVSPLSIHPSLLHSLAGLVEERPES